MSARAAETRRTVTRLLADAGAGRRGAVEELAPLIYGELKQLAAAKLRGERPGHTLQATALVHEAWLGLVDDVAAGVDGRRHFFGIASRTIRRVLVNHARRRGALKRGERERLDLDVDQLAPARSRGDVVDLLALDEALSQLEGRDSRQARIVELRFFAGLTIPETAAALEISPATVKRDWEMARAWLYRELRSNEHE